jgi:hypothetical protein
MNEFVITELLPLHCILNPLYRLRGIFNRWPVF